MFRWICSLFFCIGLQAQSVKTFDHTCADGKVRPYVVYSPQGESKAPKPLLIFLHGYTSFKLYKKAKDVINKSIGLGGVLVTIGILVSGIGDYTLFSRSVSGCLWAIFAIIMSAWIEIKE